MKSLLEYSDGEIALILVGGGVLAALTMCLGLCGLLHGYVHRVALLNYLLDSRNFYLNARSLTLKMLLNKQARSSGTDKLFRYRPHRLTRVLFHHPPLQLFPFPSAAHLVELLGPRGQRQRQTGEQKQRREGVRQWNSFDKGKHMHSETTNSEHSTNILSFM